MKLFFLYIAASHMARTLFFLFIHIVSCHIYYFLEQVTLNFFLTWKMLEM